MNAVQDPGEVRARANVGLGQLFAAKHELQQSRQEFAAAERLYRELGFRDVAEEVGRKAKA